MALKIRRRSGERIQICVGDVVGWIRVERIHGNEIGVVVDGDSRIRVVREELVQETETRTPDQSSSGYDYDGRDWEDV